MQISELANQYTSTNATPETVGGARGVETLVSAVRNLTVGNIFEGTVNAIKGNQVILGLSSGTELAARIEANMQLVQGQSMFFQVKSNDGNTIAIRPYTVDGNGANLTLLNALKAANLPVADKYLTMVNTMMQEQMPIDKASINQMARILMNNPGMNVQTLVQMKKLGLPITTEMVSQFENYQDDKSAVHSALNRFVSELPATMSSGNLSLEQMKSLDSQLLLILTEGLEFQGQITNQEGNSVQPQTLMQGETVIQGQVIEQGQGQSVIQGQTVEQASSTMQGQAVEQTQSTMQGQTVEQAQATIQGQVVGENQSMIQGQMVEQEQPEIQEQATEQGQTRAQVITNENANSGKVVLLPLFEEAGVTPKDSPAGILHKLANYISNSGSITREMLQEVFSSKDVQNLMKQVIEQQLLIEPKDMKDGEKLKKLYDTLDSKTQSIEGLLQEVGLKDTPLSQTVSEIHANIDFMNKINEAYTFAQIPLKMSNQNASGQLYVYTSKRNLEDPERDVTAFLHLDLEHLGATDVSVRMHKKEVSTKFYMENDAAYDLVKAYMPQLEERLRTKGYNCKIEIENEGRHVNFVEDFLKKDTPSVGMLHRYSFDVRT